MIILASNSREGLNPNYLPDKGIADEFIVAIDPGTRKCGIAVIESVKGKGVVLRVVRKEELLKALIPLLEEFMPETVVMGDGTGHKEVRDMIVPLLDSRGIRLVIFPERSTTVKAARLYVDMVSNPIAKLFRFIKSLFINLDDLAAMVIGLEFLKAQRKHQAYFEEER